MGLCIACVLLILFPGGLPWFSGAVSVLVTVSVAIVAVTGGLEVDAVDDVRHIGKFSLIGQLLDLEQIPFVDFSAAHGVQGNIAQGCQNGGVCQNAVGRSVDDNGVILLFQDAQDLTQQRMTEQGNRIGHHGAGVKDIHSAGVFP